ncbi:MAG: hypothetical protein ACRDKT_08980 [Actinomycetota bacterium]
MVHAAVPAPGDAPVGDAAAMRAYAGLLRKEAEAIAARAAWLARRAERMSFEGPAAATFRQGMLDARRSAERAAADLKDVANHLLSGAARVETDSAEWKRLQALLEQGRAS